MGARLLGMRFDLTVTNRTLCVSEGQSDTRVSKTPRSPPAL